MSMMRQQAIARLQEVQARLYQISQEEAELKNEARAIAGYLNLARREEQELAQAAKSEVVDESPVSS